MLSKKEKQLKVYLDEKVELYNRADFIQNDPIQLPHQFSNPRDIEIIALLVATFAWGNRTSIIKNGKKLVEIMENQPFQFITQTKEKDWSNLQFVHRTFNAEDLKFFFFALQNIYKKHKTLEEAFYLNKNEIGIKYRIANFRKMMFETPHLKRSEKHISNPLSGSAAKRLNMFLRWMVRKDNNGVDFGIWKNINASELHIPLDVHTSNVSRNLGILTRKQNDWRAVEEIQKTLVKFDSNDPAKYDFALFGIGMGGSSIDF